MKVSICLYLLPLAATFPDNRAVAYSVSPLGRGEAQHSPALTCNLQGQLSKTVGREAKLWHLDECRKLRYFSLPKA